MSLNVSNLLKNMSLWLKENKKQDNLNDKSCRHLIVRDWNLRWINVVVRKQN
ncbi:hypothetical protein [Neisseria meningitidis serogroup B]|uniref:Uncharacterized protein n=1 Tax=Neisseria meningitidis serogroup B TaxID=491 RepID=A0A0H5QER1_NEIMI|nr:hypothetical protein [Neisseria meningitidis serogroup B]